MMRRNSLFWGVIIIVAGFLFLLDNLKLLPISAWELIWPAFLIVVGLWFLFGRGLFRNSPSENTLAIPLEQASQAEIRINHGAGRLSISSLPNSDQFLSGVFTGGVENEVIREGSKIRAKLSAPSEVFWGIPWFEMSNGFSWQVNINPDVALDLVLKTGASENQLNLTDLKVATLSLDTGASSTSISLPVHSGLTIANVHAGAASVDITFPTHVAGRIRIQSGIAGINVNSTRFPKNGNFYQSPDFDSASDKVELFIEAGVGSINIA
jgi:hypothetical protein